MQFCRHIAPLYPGAGIIGRHTPVTYAVLPAYHTVVLWRRDNRPSHASYLCSFAGILHRCTLAPVHRPSQASYLCRFAGILHRCTLAPVNRSSHASRESGVAYLIGEVNCRCFCCCAWGGGGRLHCSSGGWGCFPPLRFLSMCTFA